MRPAAIKFLMVIFRTMTSQVTTPRIGRSGKAVANSYSGSRSNWIGVIASAAKQSTPGKSRALRRWIASLRSQ